MGKRVILYLFLLFSLSLQAQTEEKVSLGNDSTEVDSTATAKPSAFKRAIKKFMNFSDFDTLYISPNRYNYALMVTHFSNFEYYSITSELPQPQKLSFSPNPHNKIGLYFGWRWIFLGWSVDVNDIFKKGTRKNRGTEFDLSLYSSKLGVDIFYRRTGNDYKIHKIRGFSDDIPSNYSEDFSGIKVDIKGLNLYYIFNNRKFSYPAAFSQSTNQRRNAGTFIAGFSISKHHLDFDYTALPGFIQEAMNPAMKVKNIKYTNANISFGYAYNWVFARNCLACLSLTPAIAYKASDVDAETNEAKAWYGKFISLSTMDSVLSKYMPDSTSTPAKNTGKRNNSTETRNHQLACLSKESLYICHVLTNKSKKINEATTPHTDHTRSSFPLSLLGKKELCCLCKYGTRIPNRSSAYQCSRRCSS